MDFNSKAHLWRSETSLLRTIEFVLILGTIISTIFNYFTVVNFQFTPSYPAAGIVSTAEKWVVAGVRQGVTAEGTEVRAQGARGRYRSRGKDLPTSLLVRNLRHDCREPRGFGFVQYVDPDDAAEAMYEMDGQIFLRRELTVVFAEENRKKPSEMRARERIRRRTTPIRSPSPRYRRTYSKSPGYYTPSPRRRHYSRSISPRDGRYRERSYSRSPYRSRSRSRSSGGY